LFKTEGGGINSDRSTSNKAPKLWRFKVFPENNHLERENSWSKKWCYLELEQDFPLLMIDSTLCWLIVFLPSISKQQGKVILYGYWLEFRNYCDMF
jgi:hypothetical protein